MGLCGIHMRLCPRRQGLPELRWWWSLHPRRNIPSRGKSDWRCDGRRRWRCAHRSNRRRRLNGRRNYNPWSFRHLWLRPDREYRKSWRKWFRWYLPSRRGRWLFFADSDLLSTNWLRNDRLSNGNRGRRWSWSGRPFSYRSNRLSLDSLLELLFEAVKLPGQRCNLFFGGLCISLTAVLYDQRIDKRRQAHQKPRQKEKQYVLHE